ncbi:MAG: hypothetical protein K6A41_03795 [Bacteroidales bacterium]|nr:hypothetical protein [Bacteroidales bacterium]
MKEETVFPDSFESIVAKNDLMVVEGGPEVVNDYQKPTTISVFYIIICHNGSIDVEYDSQYRRFQSNSVAILYPNHTVMASNPSPDYRYSKIIVSSERLKRMAVLNMNVQRFSIEREPQNNLSESQYTAQFIIAPFC